MKTIHFEGRAWRLHRATESRLIFRRDEIPATMIAWRKNQKLSQRSAAKVLGISQGQLARIESGTRVCPPGLIEKLK